MCVFFTVALGIAIPQPPLKGNILKSSLLIMTENVADADSAVVYPASIDLTWVESSEK